MAIWFIQTRNSNANGIRRMGNNKQKIYNVKNFLKVKLFISEYWVLISWFITVLIDTKYNILEDIGLNKGLISLVRIGGSALLACFTKREFKIQIHR